MKKGIGKFVIFLLILIVLGIVLSHSTIAKTNEKKVDSKIYDKLQKEKNVSVIIKYRDQKIIGKGLSFNEMTKNRPISKSLNVQDMNELLNDSNVEGIYLNGKKNLFLSDSTVIVNATRTWNLQYQNSINLTGAGQSVCIIDTGIDYNHPDLSGNYIGGWDFLLLKQR